MKDSVRLIGAAFPRTGTMSVKRALEMLGFGVCYHMHEVFLNPHHVPIWEQICDGLNPDWETLFGGYTATLDGPACHYWKEQMSAFPEARVLLLRRDPDTWYESVLSTLYPVMVGPASRTDPALKMIRRIFLDHHMRGSFTDKHVATSIFRRYCDEVQETVPADRLLIFEVSQGWQPLCDFLGYDVPDQPFPITNTRPEFRTRTGLE